MGTDDGNRPSPGASPSDVAAELAALDAEIARLSLRRDQLRAQATSTEVVTASTSTPATATTSSAPTATVQPKPDWYPDPSGRFSWRYWNGTEWTENVARNGRTYTDPPVASAPTASTTTPAATTSTTPAATTPTTPAANAPTAPGTPIPPRPTAASSKRMRADSNIDIGKVILIVGAALLIGGVAGLTVWLWSRLPAIGRLGLLGLAFILQTAIALRIRERLQTAAEAFAATGAATLLFAVGSVSLTATWNGTVGVAVGCVGVALLLTAKFRAWVIAGHAAIVVGGIALIVAEPWSQTAFIVAVVVGATRLVGVRATTSIRPANFAVYPEWLTATSLAVLFAVPALALVQFDSKSTVAVIFVLVAIVVSEVVARTRANRLEHTIALFAGAAVVVSGVAWSIVLWVNGGQSDGYVGLAVTAVVALLVWRVGRTDVTLRSGLQALSVALVPVAARFASNPSSAREMITFCAVFAVVGVAVTRLAGTAERRPAVSGLIRLIDRPLSLWFWVGAVIASNMATEQLAAWPRLALATVAIVAMVPVMKFDELWYVAATTATLTVLNLFYTESFAASWWFRPDVVGVAAAIFLFVANRRQSTERLLTIDRWTAPRYWECAVAALVVPVSDVVSRLTFTDLPSSSKWRLTLIVGAAIVSWAYGFMRKSRMNAAQLATAMAVGAVLLSRVADESRAIRTGAWVIIGCIATAALAWIARHLKRDEFRYASAVTATITVAVLLYGDWLIVAWWFRPDVVGVSAAVFLYVANRAQTNPWSARIATWTIPRYVESALTLMTVPVAALASQRAFNDLSTDSKWRLGGVIVLLVGAWLHGAVRRATPHALQVATLLAIAVVVVSRVGDESLAIRTGAWVIIGFGFVAAALLVKRVELLVPAAACWMLVVFMYSPPGPLEVLTGSLAAIAAFVALLARRFGRRGTFDFIPATAVALVPSAFVAARAVLDSAVNSEQVVRLSVVLSVSACALAIGAYKRLAALVGPSVISLIVLAAAQLIVVQRRTSGWITALIAGAVLLAVGTRLEYLRSVSRRASDLVRSLR